MCTPSAKAPSGENLNRILGKPSGTKLRLAPVREQAGTNDESTQELWVGVTACLESPDSNPSSELEETFFLF